jgi:hypothetical protein
MSRTLRFRLLAEDRRDVEVKPPTSRAIDSNSPDELASRAAHSRRTSFPRKNL